MEEIIKKISLHADIDTNRSLQDCTTLRIGGNVDYMVYPYDLDSAVEVLKILSNAQVNRTIIGNGSNLLASDQDYHGIVIRLSKYLNQYDISNTTVIADAGCSIISLAFACAKEGLSGLEFAGGIPASLGGTIYMNAGAYKSSMREVVEAVLVFKDGECAWLSNEECQFGYRRSIFQAHRDWVILGAKLQLQRKDKDDILSLMDSRRQRRFDSQPLDVPSAGSVFRNPSDNSAWTYIDGVGLRGYRIGDAQVSQKHPNFIVNVGKAKASDYYELVQLIQQKVKDKYDICLLYTSPSPRD